VPPPESGGEQKTGEGEEPSGARWFGADEAAAAAFVPFRHADRTFAIWIGAKPLRRAWSLFSIAAARAFVEPVALFEANLAGAVLSQLALFPELLAGRTADVQLGAGSILAAINVRVATACACTVHASKA